MPFIGRNSPIKRQRAISGAGGDENKLPYACEADPSENYKKHKRRKTKPDKYEYKGNRNNQRNYPTHQQSAIHKQFTPKVARHETFQVPNNQAKPFSLQTSRHSRIFGDGRFSASFEGRDLPDLTFCEMSFLSNKANHRLSASRDSTNPCLGERQQVKSVQPKISDYFSKAGCYESISPRAHAVASLGPGIESMSPRTLFEKLPGIESREPGAISPVAAWSHGVQLKQQQQAFLHSGFRRHERLDAQTASQLRSTQPRTSNTTCASWSVSGQREEARKNASCLPESLYEQITKVPGGQARMLTTNLMASQCNSPSQESLLSNAHITDHVRQALLPRYESDARFQYEKSNTDRKYSLQDLKELAVEIELEDDRQLTDETGCEVLHPVAKPIVYQEIDGICITAPLEVTDNPGVAERAETLQNGLLVNYNRANAELGSAPLLDRLQKPSLTIPKLLDNQQTCAKSCLPSTSSVPRSNSLRSGRDFFDHPADCQLFSPECKCRNSTEPTFDHDEICPVGMSKLRDYENLPGGQPGRLSDPSDSTPSVVGFEPTLDPLHLDEFDANLFLDGNWHYGRGTDRVSGNVTRRNDVSVGTSATEASIRGRFGICVQLLDTFGRGEHGPRISGNNFREGERNDSARKGPVLLRPSLEPWSDVGLFAPFTKPNRLSR